MNIYKDFLNDLMIVGSLRLAGDNAIEEWGGDIPVTLLFATLGRSVVEGFDDFSPEEQAYVFGVIELGMKSENIDLTTLVATGLLESLCMQTSGDAGLMKRIDAQLGEMSRKYLIDWDNWHRS